MDVLADQDLNRIASGVELRHLYRMVVFESHGEYVTSHMFDITEQYRNLGGHLAFLSANDFFRDVLVSSDSMTLIGRFRDIGRPEAALIGAQYIDWYRNRYPSQPYRVVRADRVPWLESSRVMWCSAPARRCGVHRSGGVEGGDLLL